MLDIILQFDTYLFGLVNQGLSNPVFDFLMPLIRGKFFWFPLYFFLLIFLFYKLKKKALALIVLVAFTVFLSDKLNSELIKKTVCRVRPCNEIKLSETIIKRVDCGNAFSFASSHAANHFALAYLFSMAVNLCISNRKYKILTTTLFFFWASSIAFAQVYVGVHYPIDVLLGALFGLSLSALTYQLYKLLKNKTV